MSTLVINLHILIHHIMMTNTLTAHDGRENQLPLLPLSSIGRPKNKCTHFDRTAHYRGGLVTIKKSFKFNISSYV